MQTLSIEQLDCLRRIVGTQHLLTKTDDLRHWGRDWTYREPRPSIILLPGTSNEVQQIMSYCWQQGLTVVPSGGRSGLVGGAVALHGEIVLSLTRLNNIRAINRVGLYAEVEAGVTTQTLQEEARQQGVMFGVDLAARGTSQVGGNIASNAGGTKFVRYGGMRQQVLGLEVVLADGQLLPLGGSVRKNNTGYDLKELFIGSEGTLGVITAATLRLVSNPQYLSTMCFAVNDFQNILRILELCHLRRPLLSAFEVFSDSAYQLVVKTHNMRELFKEGVPFYILLELDGQQTDVDQLVEEIFDRELSADGVIAQSSSEQQIMWQYRELIPEALASYRLVKKSDVSVPIPKLGEFIAELEATVLGTNELVIVIFGHIADGNIHINYASNDDDDEPLIDQLEMAMNELVSKYNGSISAEHGIGLRKKNFLSFSRSAAEINIMRHIKRCLDHKNILNPGKIFDLG